MSCDRLRQLPTRGKHGQNGRSSGRHSQKHQRSLAPPLLTLPTTDRQRQLQLRGITEADDMYLFESEEGACNRQRPAHKRGISSEQVCILVARDREGKTRDSVTGKGPVTNA